MKSDSGSMIFRRLIVVTLSVMFTLGMIPPMSQFAGIGNGNVYAAMPADGTGWTASGANGLKYFQNIYGTGTQVTSLSFGQTLNTSGSPYYIMNSITLRPQYPDSYKRTSALKINGNVKLIFLNNSSLTVQGGRALGYGEEYYRGSTKYTNWDSNMGGAGAGIELSSGNTLTVDGSGYIYATGGRAGNGQKGESPDGGNDEDSNSRGYHGGKGGRGGGGAGAGIGTKGGAGSTDQGYSGGGDAGDGSATASGGGPGGNGKNSDNSGTFIQYGNVRISATAGDGGRGGDRGTSRWESQSYRDAHGGGGGGGGAGLPANAIGSGGPGGGAGGGGGGGAVKRDNNGSCAGGSGGGGGGGWDYSQVARGGERGGYDTEKGSTNAYGNNGKDASGDFDGSTFSGGAGGKRKTASSARAGKGGKGGSSGSYGSSGTIVGSNTGNGQQYRRTVDNYWAGGRSSTYCVVPKREITITVKESDTAKLNPDGKSYLYKPGVAVAPKVEIKHIPTGVNLNEDTYNTSVSPRQSYQNYNYYTVYSNNTGAPPVPNPREASVRVLANSLTADQWQRKIVNNNVNGGIPGGAGTLKDIDYKIDYETYKVTLDAAGGIGTRTVDVKLGATHTWGPGFNGNEINAPTREGFVFGGFYTAKDGAGTKYFDEINSDVSYARPCKQWTTKGNGTLYAKWIPLTYKIRFWSVFQENGASEYVEYNLSDFVYENPGSPETSAKLKPATYGNLVLPSAHDLGISRDHYDFVGWNIYEEQDWAMYKAGKTYKAGLTTKQDDIVNIYAAWRAKDQLIVSYDGNGGSGAPPVDGTWADADYKISNQVPVREGYTFKGWNSAASPEYDEVTGKQTNGFAYTKGETVKASDTKAIKASTTLYAQWERNPSVSYRANGGSLETAIPTKYPAKESTVTIDYGAITRTGYEFVGWHVKGSSNHNVYVENAPAQSKITIDGTEYNLNQATTFKMPAESVVLEALWTPEKMDIDFVTDSKGGEKGLYDLDGWYYADSEGERLPETETAGIKSVNSMEIEYDKPLSFQVVVDRNKVDDSAFRLRINDINTAPADVEVNDETNIATYKFAIAKVRAGQMIQTAGLVGKTFPVILDANEGELRGTVTSHTFGEATALPTKADSDEEEGNTPVKKGFAFQGWYDNADLSGDAVEAIDATKVPADGTFTFYAKWNASKYNIAFDLGSLPGGDGSTLQWKDDTAEARYNEDIVNTDQYKNIPYSEEKTLPALNDYIKYEYGANVEGEIKKVDAEFFGWATKKGATDHEFSSGQVVRRLTDKDEATVTLYPVWGAPRYKLVLDPNGGKVTKSITGYQAGEDIDLTKVVPVRAGYEFGGWFGEKIEDDADVSGKTPVTSIPASEFGDKTYYAYWTAKEYKYTLKGIDLATGNPTEESWQPDVNLKVGQAATLDLPVKTADDPSTEDVDETEYYITPPAGKELAGWTERYNPVMEDVTPTPSGGEDDSEDPTPGEGGDEEDPDDPTIIGYVPGAVLFTAGEETADLWTTDDEGNFVGRTLYPVWKNADDETLIYDANGGQEAPDMVEAPMGTKVDVDFENAPKREGYIFAGYDTEKTTAHDSENLDYPAGETAKITLDTSKRLYAIWKPVAYDITFDAAVADSEENVGFDDGSENWSKTMTQTVAEYEEEVALSSKTPSRGSMYEFLGWSTVKNGQVEYQPGSIVSQFADVNGSELTGKTLYAIWLTKDPAYLSFDAMGGSGAPSMETHPQGTEVSVKADDNRDKPKYHGYTFKGWGTSSEDPAGSKVEKVTMPDKVENKTLYAIWEKNQSIRLVYDSGSGATGSVPTDPTSYYEGETASVLYRPAPSKTGYEFLGWNVVNKNGETVKQLRKENEDDTSLEITDVLIGAADEGQLILKAAFKANEYTVSFDGNGAKSGDAPAAITKKYDDGEVEIPKHNGEGTGDGSLVAPTGFSFAGWNTEKDGSGTMLQPGRVNWELSTAANDEVTLYAIWTAAATDVVFDNGESDNYKKTFEYGQVLPDNLDAPKKTGHDFKYYYIEEYSHNDEGKYLDADGHVVETQEQAEVLKTKYYDDSMEPQKKWEMTTDDLAFQVGGGDKFNMKAEWEAQTYTISYHDDKGVLVNSQDITYGKDFRMADAADLEVPSGYRHVGWKLKNDPEQITPDFDADKGVTPTKANGLYNNGQTVSVYAVFQEIRKFKVNYDANGGTDAPQDNIQYEPGEKATVSFTPVPSRANYDFLGWTTYSNTSSVLPGGANEGKYYADSTIDGVETIDGYTYHYGEEGGSNAQKEINIEMRNDVKFYAVWVQKTYYTVDFFGNSTSNGGAGDKVSVKGNTFRGPDNRMYTKTASNDGYRTDEAIFRSTSPYKGDKSTKLRLPDGSAMFKNDNDGAKFMGWAKNTDARVADHAAGEDLEDITMDENVVLSAVWAYPVRNVVLTDIEKPAYESTPSEDVEATAASGVSVTKSTWSPSTDKFAAGTKYKLSVKMKANDGFYFDKDNLPTVKMDVTGIEEQVDATAVLNTEGSVLTAVCTFNATENIIVNGDKDVIKVKPVAVTGITAPEAGKKLVTAGNAGDSRVDNESWFPQVAWTATDAEGHPRSVTATAEPDTIYKATVRLRAAKGYEVKADTTRVTFSGETVDTVVDEETGELIVSYTFPKTAAIDNVINLKLSGALRNGQNLPDQTFTSADNVDKDSRLANIRWFKIEKDGSLTLLNVEKAKVSPSTTYVAQVTLRAADGYSFAADTTRVTFGGHEMPAQAKAEPEGNNWVKLTDNGAILVSHEFTSSADVLQEIIDPSNTNAAYGTKVSEVEDLPRFVTIITEEGKKDVEVTWVGEDNKVIIVDGEQKYESVDAQALNLARTAHAVRIQGAVTVPDGVTVPDEMNPPTATLTVKVSADPRLVPEAEAADLEKTAAGVMEQVTDESSERAKVLKTALEEAIAEMNDYIGTWNAAQNPSTVEGIEDEIEKVRAAMIDLMNELEPIPVLPVSKVGEIKVGEKLPVQVYSNDDRIDKDSQLTAITWINTQDKIAREDTTYWGSFVFRPSQEGAFKEDGLIVFDDNVQIQIHGDENTDGNHAWIDPAGNLHVIRAVTTSKIDLVAIDAPAALDAGFGDAIADVGLPKTVDVMTDASDRKLNVNWNTEGVDLGDTTKREAHDVIVEGTVVKPDSITNSKDIPLTIGITIHVAADPRLKPEAEADKVITKADEALAAAAAADIENPEAYVNAVNGAKAALNGYIADLAHSTPEGIEQKTRELQEAVDALNNYIGNNGPIELSLWGIKKAGGTLKYNAAFPDEVNTTDETVHYQDRRQEADWQTDDGIVISGRNYIVEVTIRPSEGKAFNPGRHIIFDGVTIPITTEKPGKTAENEEIYAYAVLDQDGSVTVGRTYQSKKANLTDADAIDPVEVAWDAEKSVGGLGLPSTDGISIDDPNRNNGRETATIADSNWNLDNFVSKDLENREAHEVEVTAVLTMPDGVNEPDPAKTVTVTVKVAADPRLEQEAAAAKLNEQAQALIEEAEKLGVGADEMEALKEKLTEMMDEVGEGNLDKSTVESDQEAIGAAQDAFIALKAVVDKKKEDMKPKPQPDRSTQYGEDGTPLGRGASAEAADNAIRGMTSDGDPSGTRIAPLVLNSVKQGKKAIKLNWNGVDGGASYVVYGNRCGKNNRMQRLFTLNSGSLTIKDINGQKLKKGKYYKFMVVALDRNNNVLYTSKVVHVATKGGKVGNHKRIRINKKVIKKARALKPGKTLKLKAKAVKQKKKVKKHRGLIYESTKPSVATVNGKGVIRANAPGTCQIYVYAQNGVKRVVTVNVR